MSWYTNNRSSEVRSTATISSLIGLASFIRPHAGLALAAVAALVFTASISLILPMIVREFVDSFSEAPLEELDQNYIKAIAIAAIFGLGTATRYVLVTRLGEVVVADIRKKVFANVIGMSPDFFEHIMTGEVVSRLNTDTTLVLAVISSSVSVALRNVLILFGGIALMMVTSTKLTLMVLVIVPVIVFPTFILSRKLRHLSRDNQDRIAEGSGNISETLLNVRAVQANTHENSSKLQFFSISDAYLKSAYKRINIRSILTLVVISLVFTGIATVIWIGARDARTGLISSGELVQFVIYAILVAGSVSALSEIWGELLRAAGATDRLVELLHTRDTISDPAEPVVLQRPVRGKIEFRNISFRYPRRKETAALAGMSFTVNPGETVAIVGPSGAGKSTIFQLLLRFYDPLSGSILIDDVDIRDLQRSEYREYIALVPQEPAIFANTARENIRFGRPGASDREVEEAARIGAAHTFLSEMPDGYDTFVGEQGIMLSGGQRQRIALSRAILRSSPILLLDEATSSLDAESERAVQIAVQKLSQQCTTLIIAHRLATVKNANRILVIDNGMIVAEGCHTDLITTDGLYARLAQLQFIDV